MSSRSVSVSGGGATSSSEDPARLHAFLRKVDPLMRGALQQNECYDIFTDDFASLADDDLGAGAGAETAMTETHSFTSLTYNKGKTVACVDWVPGARGAVAASCVATASFEAAVAAGGAGSRGARPRPPARPPGRPRRRGRAPRNPAMKRKTALLIAGIALTLPIDYCIWRGARDDAGDDRAGGRQRGG
mgnify:CR=1 FL=1